MILSLEWAQHIMRGTCWFSQLLCTFMFSCGVQLCTITVVRSKGGTDKLRKTRGIRIAGSEESTNLQYLQSVFSEYLCHTVLTTHSNIEH